jgi:hypothetical protein
MQLNTTHTGSYSRFSYDETKRYVMVLKEQGVPLLDDEINAPQEMILTELRRSIKALVGDGSPDAGFKIVGDGSVNDFNISAGTIFIDGWRLKLTTGCKYSTQELTEPGLTTPSVARTDKVYLDLYLDEVDDTDDSDIVDPVLLTRTSCRWKIYYAVKVAEGSTTPVSGNDVNNRYHWYYKLATIARTATSAINAGMVTDERPKIISAASVKYTSASNIAATNVQDALTELDNEKFSIFTAPDYAADTSSSANSIIITLANYTAHVIGVPIKFKAAIANSGATTISISGLTAVAIKKKATQALDTGDILTGQVITVIYDGTYFQMVGTNSSSSATGTIYAIYGTDTGSANTYSIAPSPAETVYRSDVLIMFKASTSNSGASTFAINSLSPVAIKKTNGKALSAGDIVLGAMVQLIYDGTYFVLVNKKSSTLDVKIVQLEICDNLVLSTDDKSYFRVPNIMNGWTLSSVAAMCKVASTSGIPTFAIKKGSTSMLSTNLTIDSGENDSSNALTPAVIDASSNTVATGDQIEVACPVSGTGVTYAVVELQFTEA